MPRKKKCKECGNLFEKRNSMQIVCGPLCAVKYTNKQSEKRALARKRQEKKKEKLLRKEETELKRKNLSWQRDKTQDAFNKMRVLQEKLWFKERGLRPECISCGKENMDWCCGHMKTRGSSPELALDPKNTFLQCNYRCNRQLSGNIEGNKHTRGYKKGLLERFGEQEGQAIIDYLESPHDPKHYTCDDYEQMRKEFNAEVRRLSKLVD